MMWGLFPLPVLGFVSVPLLVAGLALAAISYALQRSSAKRSNIANDDTPTTLATRGTGLPYLLGRRRIGVLFGWAGNRNVKEEGGGGGKGGGPKAPGSKVYYEDAWLQLCLGPVQAIYGLWVSGEKLVNQTIDAETHPNGTVITVDGKGSFAIYWGDFDQPVNHKLAGDLGIGSRWPCLCYLHVIQWRLGSTPQWGQWEVEAEVLCGTTTMQDSALMLADTDGSRGINPAHAILHALTAPHPHGLGLDPGALDGSSLEALGELMEAEHLPMNLLLEQSAEVAALLQGVLQDAGVMMPMVGTRLAFIPAREATGDLPALDDVTQGPPVIGITSRHGVRQTSRVVYSYPMRANNYRAYDIKFDDDGLAVGRGNYRAVSIELTTVTDPATAAKVTRRRIQEDMGDTVQVSVNVLRAFRSMVPGQQLLLPDGRTVRIFEVKVTDGPMATLECMLDSYGVPETDDASEDQLAGNISLPVAVDPFFDVFEFGGGIVVPRLRAHQQILGSTLYLSTSGTTYYVVGNQDTAAAGGEILNPIASGASSPIGFGPYLIDTTGDMAGVLDLSGDPTAHAAGLQLMFVGNEVMFASWAELIGCDYLTRSMAMGPSLMFRFDETDGATTAANWGSGADGSYAGTVTLEQDTLLANDSADFAAGFTGDGRIETGHTSLDSTGSWTVATLMALTATASDQVVCDRENGTGTGRVFLGVRGTGAGADAGKLFASIGAMEFESTEAIAWDEIHAVAVVFDAAADELVFVIDGEAGAAIDVSAATPQAATGQVLVGRSKAGDRPLIGTLCEFALIEDAVAIDLVTALTASPDSQLIGWRMRDLIRAQEGSTAGDHASGTSLMVIERSRLNLVTHSLIESGNTIYIKSRPYTLSGSAAMGDITPVTKTLS